jgi:hypothetical protein
MMVALLFLFAASLSADDKDKKDEKKTTKVVPAQHGATPAVQHQNQTPAVTPHNSAPVYQHQTQTPAVTPHNSAPVYQHQNQTPAVAHPSGPYGTTPGVHTPGASPTGHTPAGAYPANQAGHGTYTGGPGNTTRYSNGRVETYHGPNNTAAHFHSDGHVSVIHTPERTIYRSTQGNRTVVVERPGGQVVVAHGAGFGYVQRPFVVHNQTYVQRTYYVNHVAYVHVYRPYSYHGVTLNVYAPSRYYHPAFYGWAYSPWRMPVAYSWGWAGSPWYGFYGGYFTPYPVYRSPAFWLTDYLFAATFQEAYQERMASAAAAQSSYAYDNQTVLTPGVKDAISQEVQRQLEAERSEAQYSGAATPSSGLPPGLSDGNAHVFVVARAMDAASAAVGGECALSEGDVLQLGAGAPRDAESAGVVVLASKGRDCRKGTLVSVQWQELVEMQNHMRETLDRGLEELRAKQGQGGLPTLPASAASAPAQAPFAAQAPPPEANVAAELRQESEQANQTEQQVVGEASAPQAGAPAPAARIGLGQSIDSVALTLGEPQKVVDLGAKKIYVYPDLKVTFTDGRVSDVQ